MTLSKTRHMELDHATRKMGGIVSVFEIRSEALGDRRFQAFRELMDVYVAACRRTLAEGKDFVEEGVVLDSEESERLQEVYNRIFGG